MKTGAERKKATTAAGESSAGKKKPPAKIALTLDLQIRARAAHVPTKRQFTRWINAALAGRVAGKTELTVCVVGPTEMRTLNREYRGKDYATNVLSFPFESPAGIALPVRVLGDIILCAHTVQREAKEQGKTTEAHWAHLVIHGVLHLLGLDHHTARHAAVMEGAEIALLAALDFPNPYAMPPAAPGATVKAASRTKRPPPLP